MQNYMKLHKNYRRFCSVIDGGYEVQVLKLYVTDILKKISSISEMIKNKIKRVYTGIKIAGVGYVM